MRPIDKLNQAKFIKSLLLLALVISLGAVATWWQYVYTAPERVFDRMLNNSLSTASVTKSSKSGSEQQVVEQTTISRIEREPKIHTDSTVTQASGEQGSSVSRETLVTLLNTYIKLTDIKTSQMAQNGQAFDFSSVLNVWGSNPNTENDNSLAQLYSQNVAVPFAHLDKTARDEILGIIKSESVYDINFDTVRREKIQGREVFVYEVGVKPAGFIAMMKSLGQKVGLKGYDDVDPAAYAELPSVPFTFTVDIISGNLVSVDYGEGQVENYGAFGLRYLHPTPKEPITMAELQQRLQNLQ